MDRRQFNRLGLIALPAALGPLAAQAQISGITSAEATRGIKAALEKGALAAVGLLGQTDGFLGNARVRIPLPGYLEDASQLLRNLGQGRRVDELVTAMNRAAEAAVPLARNLLVSAARGMSVQDAYGILTGGDTSVTQFFASKTREPLAARFLPIVTRSIEKVGLAQKYNDFAGKAAAFGLVKKEDANIQSYVTGKALDGLYTVIGDQERSLRSDPAAAGVGIIQKVFGAIR